MQEHMHTGPIAFLYAGISAVVFLKLMEIIAANLVDNPRTETIGKVLGGLLPGVGSAENVNA